MAVTKLAHKTLWWLPLLLTCCQESSEGKAVRDRQSASHRLVGALKQMKADNLRADPAELAIIDREIAEAEADDLGRDRTAAARQLRAERVSAGDVR